MENHSQLHQKGKSYLKQLLQVAMADGQLDAHELHNLSKTAERFGVSEAELTEIRQNADSVKFVPPSGTKEKFHLIYDLVWMMMVDGDVAEKEMRTCENLAMQLGFSPEIIEDLSGFIRNNADKGISTEEAYAKLEKML